MPGEQFFELDGRGLEAVLALLPATSGEGEPTTERLGRALVDEIKASIPDVETISEVVEESKPTDAGLDVLATVTALKKHRRAIDRLKDLVDTQASSPHPEKAYLDLIAENPWMLGSQYNEVIRGEASIWFGSRVDLRLKSALGYKDIAELKRPDAKLVVRGTRKQTWRASEALSDVLAQSRKYLRIIDERRDRIARELDLPESHFTT